MNLRKIPRKYLLIGSHCLVLATAVLVTFLYIKQGSRDRVGVGEIFLSYVRVVPYHVAYEWGSREDAKAAVLAYIENPGQTFVDNPRMLQKELFFAKSRLAVLGNDPHATIAQLCREMDDSCGSEPMDRWVQLIRRGRKVPD
jgi:hypothetical protein